MTMTVLPQDALVIASRQGWDSDKIIVILHELIKNNMPEDEITLFFRQKACMEIIDQDLDLTVDELADKYGDEEHPYYTDADWREEVRLFDTRLGYWEWVRSSMKMDA